jgi:hypothetical protein
MAPNPGTKVAGPKSGANSSVFSFSGSASYSPLRMSASDRRSGLVAAYS